jgi:hypothetical protein
MTCPDETTVVRLLQRDLPKDRVAELEEHFDRCALCRALIARLVQASSVVPATSATVPADAARLPAPHRLPPGASIHRYRIAEIIGEGGMGVVYRAEDPDLGRAVAIKMVHPRLLAELEPALARARLLREAHALAALNYPNVLTVYDVGTWGDDVFIAVELVEGQTLRTWL